MSSLLVFMRWKELKSGCVSSRIICIKFKISRVKVCDMVGYGPNEGDGEERDFERIMDPG